MLGALRGRVFSKRAVLGTGVGADDAGGDAGMGGGGRSSGAVGGRRHPVHALEAGRERPDSLQSDLEADLGDRVVGVPQQRRRPLQPAGQQVDVGRLTEGATELTAEVGLREPGGSGQVIDLERLGVVGVGEVLGTEQVTGGGD